MHLGLDRIQKKSLIDTLATIFKPGHEIELAQKTNNIINDKIKTEKIVNNASTRYEKNFSNEKYVNYLYSIIIIIMSF